MQSYIKVTSSFIFIFFLLHLAYSEENISLTRSNIGTIPEQIQDTIIRTVDKLQPSLVRIHVVEKYYSEGRELKQEKYGSGVIISSDGYVVTNHHVAGKAHLADCSFSNLKNYSLKLIGTDALTDISVLKIITDEPQMFDFATFGDSDKIKVGDYVLAMGSPMALNPSVTLGIISNQRMILPYKLNSFEMFTSDGENVGSLVCWLGHNAEISPGSSGGPLVNLQGEIIGINEIKYALGGAIPSNLVKKVVNDIIQNGKVKRSWTGLEIQPITKDEDKTKGALVRYVYPQSPADIAGIKTGDIIIQIEDEPILVKYMEQIPLVNNILCSLPTDKPTNFHICRDTNMLSIPIQPVVYDFPEMEEKELREWGFTAKNLNWFLALNKNRENTRGVLVTSLRMGGSSAQAKPPLQSGDIILEVENMKISSLDELSKITQSLLEEKKEKVFVVAERNGNKIYSIVKIGASKTIEPVREASKPWIGVEVQVFTQEMAEKKNIDGGGFIVTRTYPVVEKGLDELQVGDIIKEIEGEKFHAIKIDDYEEWKEKVRSFSIDQEVTLSIIRDSQTKQVHIQLIKEPLPRNMAEKYQDEWLEFTVRELCFYDRVEMNLKEETRGVFVEQVISGGWASLAKLEQGDIILSIQNEPVENIKTFKEKLKYIREKGINKFLFEIQRGIQKYFVPIEVK